MHGHQYHVLKMAFPEYNKITGAIASASPDIDCDTPYCNYPTWKNKSWHGDNIPGLNLVNPPLKDTVIVPRNGYVIIRLKANNPGLFSNFTFIMVKICVTGWFLYHYVNRWKERWSIKLQS